MPSGNPVTETVISKAAGPRKLGNTAGAGDASSIEVRITPTGGQYDDSDRQQKSNEAAAKPESTEGMTLQQQNG